MAPARRKGGGKNSSAAVARRLWKVGDLVLAKVKGFPAWPATVSEPQKWGYSTDWKKVLVHFFGTKQIAFCNPADVEAFTEEKKNVLLSKRHGKGSDFVRAVNEIVDTYEKLKKQGGGDLLCDEVATLNNENSENLPRSTFSSLPKTYASLDHSDSCSADEIPLVSGAPELHDTEVVSKVAFENALGLDQLSETHLSIKKRSQVGNGASQKVDISVRRSRSSSRTDSYKRYQMSENNLETDGFSYKNGRKENLVGESLHTSECPDLDLLAQSAIVSSNASDAWEVLKVGIDTVVGNAHTCVKCLSYEDEPHGCGGCVENDALSSGSDESEASAVTIKRIREQVRSQGTDGAAETSSLDEERYLQNEQNKQTSCFSNVCENCDSKMYGVDGDEHLPLVKRARVRMGKAALNKMCKEVEKKSFSENLANDIETRSLSTSCHTFDSQRSCVGYFARMDCSPSKTPSQITGNNTDLLNAKNLSNGDHIFDSETALPPSKRLHRALEAMNANVADGAVEAENTKPLFLERTTTTSGKLSSLEVQDALLSNGEKSCYDTFFVLGNESQRTRKMQKNTNQSESAISKDNDVRHIAPNYKLVNNLSDVENPEDLRMDSHIDHESMLLMKSTTDSYQLHEKLFDMETDKSFSEADENVLDSSSNSNHVVPTVQGDSSRERMLDLHLLSGGESVVCDLESVSVDDRGGIMCSGPEKKPKVEKGYLLFSCASEGVKSLQSKFNTKLKLDMHELKKNSRAALSPECIEISSCTNKMEDVNKVKRFNSPTASKSRDCKVVTEAMFSQYQFNGITFSEQVSSCLSNNGTRSDIIDRDQNKSLLGKDKPNSSELLLPRNHNSSETLRFQGEADPLWRAFKAAVRSVSRTKESIARATRLALDCAKHGMCHEVIKLLLRNLESESNLHRRIDLFFLVDSITQCAHGQKEIKGGNYSSAVEVVLPRLLSAAAPLGNDTRENRKQCLKVLRLWLERKILPESIVRQQLQELESCDETPYSYSVHSTRTERGINDPLVEVEGMLVDEYGSNTSMQLSGFTMPQMLEDEEETLHNDVQIFEAVTPERDPGIPDSGSEEGPVVAFERRPHILEEVDGELEMEDVAPSCDSDVNAGSSVPFVPPLPEELPPSPPPLPVSPPPAAPSIPPSSVTQLPVIRMSSGFSQGVGEHWPRQPNFSCVKSFPESFPCHSPGLGNSSMQASTIPPSRSYGISRGSHSAIHPSNNNIRRFDTGVLPHKPYHIRPPPSTVSSQFSYVQANTHRGSQTINYSSNLVHQRSNFEPEIQGSNQGACRNRMNLVERTTNERCRYSSPANLGQRHDKSEGFHPPIPYRPLSAERPISDHGWHIAHRPLHQRHHSAVSPPFQSSTRAPQFWKPG